MHTKLSVQQGQAKLNLEFKRGDLPLEAKNLWQRISGVFGTQDVKVIQKRLELKSEQAVYKWQKGNPPSLDTLLKISDLTGSSIHWLVTGVGPERVDNAGLIHLTDIERRIIQNLADETDNSFDEALHRLLREALFKRGAEMLSNIYDLSRENLNELQLLVGLVVNEGKTDQQVDLSPHNRRTGS